MKLTGGLSNEIFPNNLAGTLFPVRDFRRRPCRSAHGYVGRRPWKPDVHTFTGWQLRHSRSKRISRHVGLAADRTDGRHTHVYIHNANSRTVIHEPHVFQHRIHGRQNGDADRSNFGQPRHHPQAVSGSPSEAAIENPTLRRAGEFQCRTFRASDSDTS